ncbi:hypothetical protein EMIHUDRAFT_111408 [Emiliania huxleyi CCMP1516]|uniref:CDP-diacylglycerol--inositol 3-phosphatidyltransferase n=3 Tax=Emiliania huxleyi TaxID=2903 RepID=A0A0D3JS40_EMIH1|nr:CDP-diacylglycerol-inositol 3-phosphatidyltransferase [Emiliania huxleyi CCMP1516]XP_005786459.1 hypothetical protein EMIHUDRAFT_111408 [Emiliania huxleyi CCMP1516]EOD26325.1 CDP-diacylglycerol-inositol 3-phosphatidyltransferase [Emiliania huxleyi CCMP1516]EOD34030.1 hypothetical protein EMIHUDRAFT_111408 [Emiliania huxleyi CCMP1516]|eukprot:XP_005778754.1 CDP-diacylglycerol-inositol 3-phosphatidyltransferase [Emiliania huxleyi CCMP1516]
MVLWPPNLIGYVRVATLCAAMHAADPAGSDAVWFCFVSLFLDYLDGPCARYLNMCSQFGDLLDHYTDHVTMQWLVYVTASAGPFGRANLAVSTLHNGVAFAYMALRGHYFKHSERGNIVTRTIEANNYWNMASMLYAANCILIPLVKLSFAGHHGMTPPDASAPLIDVVDAVGAAVTLSYSFAVWL